ncbi:unnamed protein product [Ceratitis capitata]|uniref:(Mediterranean fruit fly) hypothetical protein n=1 Tax=Ceratitis capitata TaxID=7213 RepID=A0A811UPT3_CERCA|nr:unnamed protein product [Ceratitis capitata]
MKVLSLLLDVLPKPKKINTYFFIKATHISNTQAERRPPLPHIRLLLRHHTVRWLSNLYFCGEFKSFILSLVIFLNGHLSSLFYFGLLTTLLSFVLQIRFFIINLYDDCLTFVSKRAALNACALIGQERTGIYII